MRTLFALLSITVMAILCVSAVAQPPPRIPAPTSPGDSSGLQGRIAYEVKWCCECVRGIGTNKESLGWMEEQRCYMHGGWCGGPRRHCKD
jgi:hypothetical protein